MTIRRPLPTARRRPGPLALSPCEGAGEPPSFRERQTIESILRADDGASAERSALDALSLLVEALDRGVGVDRALTEARAALRGRRG